MEFTIPQFIEKESKLVGPFNRNQLILFSSAAGICIFLFFTNALPMPVFIAVAVILLGGALALCFVKIKGIPVPTLIKNFSLFVFKPKIYIWKRKVFTPLPIKTTMEKTVKKDDKEKSPLKLQGKSRLRDLSLYIETKNIRQ